MFSSTKDYLSIIHHEKPVKNNCLCHHEHQLLGFNITIRCASQLQIQNLIVLKELYFNILHNLQYVII